jgi:hypothetical protein
MLDNVDDDDDDDKAKVLYYYPISIVIIIFLCLLLHCVDDLLEFVLVRFGGVWDDASFCGLGTKLFGIFWTRLGALIYLNSRGGVGEGFNIKNICF